MTPLGKNAPPRTVFFDAGNTLLDVRPSVGEIYEDVSRDLGCEVPAAVFESHLRVVWREHQTRRRSLANGLRTSEDREYEMWRHMAHEMHDRVEPLRCDRDRWFESLHAEFGRPERFRTFPEVLALLGDLRDRGVRIGLISNWDSRLERILTGTGLSELLDTVVISSRVGYAKPHRRIFEIALEEHGRSPREAVHVGDSFRDDVEGAQGVGMVGILVRRRGGLAAAGGAASAKPRCPQVGSLAELPALLFG